MTAASVARRVVDGLLGLAREVLRQEVGVVGVEGARLLDATPPSSPLSSMPSLAVFAALALLRGLFHPGALTLLLGEGGALLLPTHGQPLWSTDRQITHHGRDVAVQPLTLATSDGVSLEAERATPGRRQHGHRRCCATPTRSTAAPCARS